MRKLFLLFASVSAAELAAEQSVSAGVNAIASSEPVPVADMISGWDGSYRRGEFAYADAEWFLTWSGDISFGEDDLGRLSVSRTYRYYYYLEFDKETADYYRAVETGQDLDQERKLDLDVKNFEAPGLEFFYDLPSFIVNDHEISVGAGISLYEPGHFQFGELKGVAAAGDTSAASATLNYRYDDDKILDHQAGVDKGIGYSLSVKAGWKYQDYRVKLSLRDLVNRFEWRNGAFTRGCINIGGGGQARCQAEGAASGISSQEKITETIPLTSRLAISYEPYDTEVHYYGHGQYQSLGVEKGFRTDLGRFGLFLYYPGLAGFAWQYELFGIRMGTDTDDPDEARNLQLNLSAGWRW